jgi:hypothetical protein
MLAALLTQFGKPLAFLALIAAALVYRAILVHQRDAALAQVAAITAQAQQYKAADDECVGAVGRQNDAVAKLQNDEVMVVQAAQTREENLVANAEARAAQARNAADALAHAKVGQGCDAAIKWANQQAPELGKW